MSEKNIFQQAKTTLLIESKAIRDQIKHLNKDFTSSVDLIAGASGRIAVMGIGKSGLIGRKIAATMSSLGIPAFFLHPSESLHGDLGMLSPQDILLVLSYTGESDEIKKVLPVIKNMGVRVIVMTGRTKAPVWKNVDLIINTAINKEACPYNLAPTASTSAMLAIGDAIAICASQKKGFKKENFASFHPSGGLGKRLTFKVRDLMRKGLNNPIINEEQTVNDALMIMTRTRLGAANVIDKKGLLVGFFTDGDLRRKLQRDKLLMYKKLKDVMTRSPIVINQDSLAVDAAKMLKKHRFDNIPVVDASGKPVGVIDEGDLLVEGIV